MLDHPIIEKNHIFEDNRGHFIKYNNHQNFVINQINKSFNREKGTFRGMHYQDLPENECKKVICLSGSILDFCTDIRRNSKTFLKTFTFELNSDKNSLLVPYGFAHGFQTLEDNTNLIYFHSHGFTNALSRFINYKDPILNIELPLKVTNISEKDLNTPFLNKDFKGLEFALS